MGHVPGLFYHLMSLGLVVGASNCYTGTSEGITITFSKFGDELFFPSIGQLNGLYGYRTDQPNEQAMR